MKTSMFVLAMALVLCSCGTGNKNAGKEQQDTTGAGIAQGQEAEVRPKVNVDSMATVIDAERNRIETALKSLKRTTIPTTNLRAQIKQKWTKLDFYTEKDLVVRIKSYPYEKISQRTEEFYFKNGKLILAFIEDNGSKNTGKAADRFGKTYYYFADESFKEVNQTNEKETGIRASDSERLLEEANEYLEIFAGLKK